MFLLKTGFCDLKPFLVLWGYLKAKDLGRDLLRSFGKFEVLYMHAISQSWVASGAGYLMLCTFLSGYSVTAALYSAE